MDPNTGRIIAAASYPTYDPQLFVGGISQADYAKLTGPSANDPLVSPRDRGPVRAGLDVQADHLVSLITMDGQTTLNQTGNCPPSLQVDGRVKTNYDSESISAPITLGQALGYSCDTFFYAPPSHEYYADQNAHRRRARSHRRTCRRWPRQYGVGSTPGIDLPAGRAGDRQLRRPRDPLARWKANKAQYCADAKTGYPSVTDPARPRVPHPAGHGELHRRLALPRR